MISAHHATDTHLFDQLLRWPWSHFSRGDRG